MRLMFIALVAQILIGTAPAFADDCTRCESISDWWQKLDCLAECGRQQGSGTLTPINPPSGRIVRPAPPTPQPYQDPCKNFDSRTLSFRAKALFDFGCANNVAYALTSRYPYESLGFYLMDEDGTTPLIRTGYEVALYRKLKERLVNREVYRRVWMQELFDITLQVIIEAQRGNDKSRQVEVNVVDVLLTAHNVTRLLARPEQWWENYPNTPAGQYRPVHDSAYPIFQDLLGQQSVDFYPPLGTYFGWTSFQHSAVTEVFYGSPGVFQYFGEANRANDYAGPSHWNGGIHYYYWIGALGRWLGDSITAGMYGFYGSKLAAFSEYLKKGLDQYERASVQIGMGYNQGVTAAEDMFYAFGEVQKAYPAMVR